MTNNYKYFSFGEKIMRAKLFLIMVFVLVVFSGCATSYNSVSDHSQSGYEIIVADEKVVLDSAYEAISSNFPATIITPLSANENGFSFFTQPMLDRTTFKFVISEVNGTSGSGQQVKGFVYSIYAYGSQFAVNSRYIEPLKEKFRSVLIKNNATFAIIPSISFK